MSSHVFVKVKMRAVDARRFVRECVKERQNGLLFGILWNSRPSD